MQDVGCITYLYISIIQSYIYVGCILVPLGGLQYILSYALLFSENYALYVESMDFIHQTIDHYLFYFIYPSFLVWAALALLLDALSDREIVGKKD